MPARFLQLFGVPVIDPLAGRVRDDQVRLGKGRSITLQRARHLAGTTRSHDVCAWIIEMRFGTGEHLLLSNRAGGQSVRIDPQAGGDEKKQKRGDCGRQNPGHSILALYNIRGDAPFLPLIPFWRVRHRRPTWTGSAISALIRVSGLRYARLTMRGGLRATSLAIFGSWGLSLGGDLGGLWRRPASGDPQVGQSRVESPP